MKSTNTGLPAARSEATRSGLQGSDGIPAAMARSGRRDGVHAATLMTLPDQLASFEQQEVRAALARLPDEMQEVLHLVFASGLSYGEAAQICGCAVGTIKSRVHRARTMLIKMLSLQSPAELFEDPIPQSIVVAAEHRRLHRAA